MPSIVLYQAVQGLRVQGRSGGKERLLLRTTISNQQSAPGSWLGVGGHVGSTVSSLSLGKGCGSKQEGRGGVLSLCSIPCPQERERGQCSPREWHGPLWSWGWVATGPRAAQPPGPASLLGRVGPARRVAACVPAAGTRAGGSLSCHLQPHPIPHAC